MKPLKSQLQKHFIDQEIHWIQRAKQDWLLLGDKSTKFFQTMATIKKRYNTIRKIKDVQGNYFEDQLGIAQVITREFESRFKSDPACNSSLAIPLSADISDTENEFLTKEITDQEILDAFKQISP